MLEDRIDEPPVPYPDRQYETVNIPYQNVFVQDVSPEQAHHNLPDAVLKKYASQIEFLDSSSGSGTSRFQFYRQAKVLAVGSGHFLVSLVAAMFESGLSKFHVLITDSVQTDRQRLANLAENARQTDPEATIEEIFLQKAGVDSWREAVRPFHSILYVSQEGDIGELRTLHAVCREEGKTLLPAICVQHTGMAGPLVRPENKGCWESAWRRLHRSVLDKNTRPPTFSSTAGALLSNVIVLELLKTITRVAESELTNKFFLLDLETLEGEGHSFMPHPLVTGRVAAEWVQDFDLRLGRSSDRSEPDGLLPYFNRLTSVKSGVFHTWQEGDLKQLPLSQCRVQVADPMSEGPAGLLPDMVCTHLTHMEARREAGLAGIEAHVSRMSSLFVTTLPPHREIKGGKVKLQEFIGVGAGETFAEGVYRGLQKCLTEELGKRQTYQNPSVKQVQFHTVDDKRCRYYLQALSTLQGTPMIGLGEEVSGFPVVWVGTGGCWYGCVGLNMTMALRRALQQALQQAQNQATSLSAQGFKASSVIQEEMTPLSLSIPSFEETTTQSELLQSALPILKRNRRRFFVFDLELEPFLKDEPVKVFGTLLREEGA
ncbi:putative thiazole-containing bacteriocin maturation protein [Paenibacillus sp. S3N08]|uniref:Thiazole-containing bacteriocin maturation protein n=1 Tax=Paenibacillus agricola TaxID=2716264 RepID=A0ABX0JEN6_9BACL|nr:putative thiazole-containing bacteriocin maturation protein [Paenibacillus agricola]NHN33691.1 putative thiazole-containing bacteriocin maturation protein [Paenibacillus agricola]